MNLIEAVAFDAPTNVPDGFGGFQVGWTVPPASYECRAQFIYERGNEAVAAARLAGRTFYKIKIWSSEAARSITPSWRMRDLRRGTEYNIIEVDAIAGGKWIYIGVASGDPTT